MLGVEGRSYMYSDANGGAGGRTPPRFIVLCLIPHSTLCQPTATMVIRHRVALIAVTVRLAKCMLYKATPITVSISEGYAQQSIIGTIKWLSATTAPGAILTSPIGTSCPGSAGRRGSISHTYLIVHALISEIGLPVTAAWPIRLLRLCKPAVAAPTARRSKFVGRLSHCSCLGRLRERFATLQPPRAVPPQFVGRITCLGQRVRERRRILPLLDALLVSPPNTPRSSDLWTIMQSVSPNGPASMLSAQPREHRPPIDWQRSEPGSRPELRWRPPPSLIVLTELESSTILHRAMIGCSTGMAGQRTRQSNQTLVPLATESQRAVPAPQLLDLLLRQAAPRPPRMQPLATWRGIRATPALP